MGIQISLPMMAFLVFMTGFAGFVDSAAGGGGLISLPAYLFAGLPPHYTYATNKFSAACGTTFATASFFKNGAMNLKVGILAAIGSFAGSALGAHIVLMLSDEVLQMMMFIILPIAAVIILWRRNLPDENRDDGTLNLKKALLALGIGLGIGLYDGMVGPGTGTFAIIAFTSLMGFDLRTANGNAKVLNLASNYASLFTYLSSGLVVFPVGIPCAISNIVGNIIGSHFALRKGAKFIRPMMLVVLVLFGVLEGGGDLDGGLAFIPQVCGHTHQQTLAEADIGAVHEEDVVHVGQVCGQLRTLIGAGQLMGQEDAHDLVSGGSGLGVELFEQLRAGLAGGGQLFAAGHVLVVLAGSQVHAVPDDGAVLEGDVEGDDVHTQLRGLGGQDVGCGIGKNAYHIVRTSMGAFIVRL